MYLVSKGLLILSISVLFSFMPNQNENSIIGNETTLTWHSIGDLKGLQKDSPKPVFIDFTADWCGWCKVMDNKTFSKPEIGSFVNQHFYAIKVDYDGKESFEFNGKKYTGRGLATRFGVTGLPTIVFLSSDYKKKKTVVGYKTPEQFLSKLKKFKTL